MAKIEVVKVNRTPNECVVFYKAVEDGEEISRPLSLTDYKNLALKNAGEPPRPVDLPPGKTWVWTHASEHYKFDTPTKNLRFGDYCLDDNGDYIFCNSEDGLTGVKVSKDNVVIETTAKGDKPKVTTDDFVIEDGEIELKPKAIVAEEVIPG